MTGALDARRRQRAANAAMGADAAAASARWTAAQADMSAVDAEGRRALLARLDSRLAEAVQDIEDGDDALLRAALDEAAAARAALLRALFEVGGWIEAQRRRLGGGA